MLDILQILMKEQIDTDDKELLTELSSKKN